MFELAVRWFVVGLDVSLKALLLAVLAAAGIRLLRIRNSNVRHRVWAGVLAGMLLLPAITPLIPALGLPIALDPDWVAALLAAASAEPSTNEGQPDSVSQALPPASGQQPEEQPPAAQPFERELTGFPRDGRFEEGWHAQTGGEPSFGHIQPGGEATSDFAKHGEAGELTGANGLADDRPVSPATDDKPSAAASAPAWAAFLARAPAILCGVWIFGTFLMTLRLLGGLWAARRLCREAVAVDPERVEGPSDVAEVVRLRSTPQNHGRNPASPHPDPLPGGEGEKRRGARSAATRPVPVFECPAITVPVTVGLLRPRILLPPEWIDWPAEKLDAILAHERTHVERADCACTLLAEINRCLYWFHPLAWWLRQQLSTLAEAACDDAAIDSTGDRASYARHLLEVATAVTLRKGRLLPTAVSMSRRPSVETRIDSILDFTRPLSKRLTWLSTLLLVGIIAPVIGIAAALRPAPETEPEAGLEENVAASDESAAREEASNGASTLREAETEELALANEPRDREKSSSEKDEDDALFIYEGTIVDEGEQPVAGATVTLDCWRKTGLPEGEPVAATTDERGRFKFTRHKSDFVHDGMRGSWAYARLIARKESFGFATGPSAYFETTGELDKRLDDEQRRIMEIDSGKNTNVLKLVADVPIRGRILDTEGQPVARAKIEVIKVWRGENGTLDAWEAAAKEKGADESSTHRYLRQAIGGNFTIGGPRFTAVAPVQTGADGRFVLNGLGRERIADAFVSGPGIETCMLRIRSRAGDTIELPRHSQEPRGARESFYSPEFTHIAGPGRSLDGRVTDRKSGQALAGVLVKAYHLANSRMAGGLEADYVRTATDAEGRYRLEGLPPGSNTLMFLPPSGMHNLGAAANLRVTAPELNPLIHDVALAAAVLVRGRVTDERTGEPVRGHVEYFVPVTSPYLQDAPGYTGSGFTYSHWVHEDGLFEIPALPGRGILAFGASEHERFPRGAGGEQIDFARRPGSELTFNTNPYYCIAWNFHRLAPLDIEPDAGEIELNLSLTSGASILGGVLAPDGQALSDYFIHGESAAGGWYRHEPQAFTVKGYFPKDGRRLMFYHQEKDLAGVRELRGDPSAKLEIALAPAATITGRLVDADGHPIENAIIEDAAPVDARADHSRGEVLTDIDGRKIVTDEKGRFILKGIIPGLKYGARARRVPESGNLAMLGLLGTVFMDVICKPGETKQLGDLQAKKPDDDDARDSAPGASTVSPTANRDTENARTSRQGAKVHDFRFTGRVLDPQGNPAAGATVRIDALRARRFAGSGEPFRSALVAKLTADSSGRFEHAIREPTLPEDYELLQVTGSKPGFGLALESCNNREQTFTLKLTVDEPVRGRVIDLEGRPVSNVRIEVLDIYDSDRRWIDRWLAKLPAQPRFRGLESASNETIDDLLADAPAGEAHSFPVGRGGSVAPEILPSARTDAQGRFEIAGLGRDRLLLVRATGPGIAVAQHYILTRPMKPVQFAGNRGERAGFTLFGSQMELVAQPSATMEGIVVDEEAGTPIAGAIVATQSMPGLITDGQGVLSTVTDDRGWYRLEGLPVTGKSTLKIVPVNAPYFMLDHLDVPRGEGSRPVRRDIRLKRGVWAAGRAFNQKTGKPVAGELFYTAFVANEQARLYSQYQGGYHKLLVHFPSGRTSADGRFRVPVVPGHGVVCFRALQTEGEFRAGFGISEIKELADGTVVDRSNWPLHDDFTPWTFHAIKEIEPAADAAELTLDLPLDPGHDVVLRFVDGTGQKLSGVTAHWWRPYFGTIRSQEGMLTLRAVSPDDAYTIRFEDEPTGFTRLVRFKAPPGEKERTITLEPAAIVTGRLIDRDGQAMRGIGIDGDYALGFNSIDGVPRVKTDADGKFSQKFPAGDAFQIAARDPWFASLAQDLKLSAGEQVDLGTYVIEIDERNRAKVTRKEEEQRKKAPQAASPSDTNSPTASSPRSRGDRGGASGAASAASKSAPPPQPAPRAERGDGAADGVTESGAGESKTIVADAIEYSGTVMDAEGKPLAGAAVLIGYPVNAFEFVSKAKTGTDGRFQFRMQKSEFDTKLREEPWRHADVWARLENYGPACARAGIPAPTTDLVLKLPKDDVPIKGQILDLEGKPVKNVEILVGIELLAWDSNDATPLPFDAKDTPERRVAYFHIFTPPHPLVRTDDEGRFEVRGIGRDRLAHLRLSESSIENVVIEVMTRPGEPQRLQGTGIVNENGPFKLRYGATFVHVAAPSRPIVGVVRDAESGELLPGVAVWRNFTQSNEPSAQDKTNERGEFRLTGLSKSSHQITAYAPEKSPYFTRSVECSTAGAQTTAKDLEIKLYRGVPVTGRIVDRSGRPVKGSVKYFPLRDNPHVAEYAERLSVARHGPNRQPEYPTVSADENGDFIVPVLPGKGVLLVQARGEGGKTIALPARLRERDRAPEILQTNEPVVLATLPAPQVLEEYQGYSLLDLKPGALDTHVELAISSGKTVAGQVVDSEGKPLAGVEAYGTTQYQLLDDGTFEARAVDPAEPRVLAFVQTERNVGGQYRATGEESAPVKVVLNACGTITGRLLDAEGKPLAKAECGLLYFEADGVPRMVMPGGWRQPTEEENARLSKMRGYSDSKGPFRRREQTDEDGRFTLTGLIPGLKFRLTHLTSSQKEQTLIDTAVAPGQTRDLGTLTLPKDAPAAQSKQQADSAAKSARGGATAGASDSAGAGPETSSSPHSRGDRGGVSAAGPDPSSDAAPPPQPSPRAGRGPSGGESISEIRVTGRVLDPEGNSATGATVRIDAIPRRRFTGDGESHRSVPLAKLRADPSGRFEHVVKGSELPADHEWMQVTASKPGFGVAIEGYFSQENPVELKLAPDEPLRGRVINLEGRPVPDVRIDVLRIGQSDGRWIDRWLAKLPVPPRFRGITNVSDETIDQLLDQGPAEEAPMFPVRWMRLVAPELLPSARSNADGRFEIAGLGRDRLLLVRTSGPGIALGQHYALTRSMQPVPFSGNRGTAGGFTLFGSEMEVVAQPSAPVDGVVVDEETGSPIAGALVGSQRMPGLVMNSEGALSTTTDERGRYRLEGLPVTGKSSLNVVPVDTPYFMLDGIDVPRPEGAGPVRRDIRLKRGVWAAGKVFNQKTGLPVAGEVFYTPFVSNEQARLYPQFQRGGTRLLGRVPSGTTDPQGHFRVPVVPGRGIILFRAFQGEGEFRPGYGISEIKEFADPMALKGSSRWPTRGQFVPTSFHVVKEIDPTADAAETAIDLAVDRGQDVVLHFVNGTGQSLTGVTAERWRPFIHTVRSDEGEMMLRAVSPDESILIRFEDEPTGATSLLRFTPREGETERTITLEAPAVVTGRLIDREGQPLRGIAVTAGYDLGFNSGASIRGMQTDADGRFTQKLPAGGPFRLTVQQPWFASLSRDLKVSAGEQVDLGTFVVEVGDQNRAKVTRQEGEKPKKPEGTSPRSRGD